MLSDRARVAGEKQRREETRRGEKKGEKMRELRGGGRVQEGTNAARKLYRERRKR